MGDLTLTVAISPPACSPALFGAISFPLFGGATFTLPLPPRFRDPLELISEGLQGLGIFGYALGPFVKVLRLFKAIIDLLKSFSDPFEIPEKVIDFVNQVASLIDFLVLPKQLAATVRGVLTMLLVYVLALKARIDRLANAYTAVNALKAQAIALGNAAMLANANCNLERLNASAAALSAHASSLAGPIAIFIILFCIITGGEMDPLPTLDSNNLSGAIFDPVIDAIGIAIAAIPDFPTQALEC